MSPSDAVATSIVKKADVNRRVISILDGEGLTDGASVLVTLCTALLAASSALPCVVNSIRWRVPCRCHKRLPMPSLPPVTTTSPSAHWLPEAAFIHVPVMATMRERPPKGSRPVEFRIARGIRQATWGPVLSRVKRALVEQLRHAVRVRVGEHLTQTVVLVCLADGLGGVGECGPGA